MSTRRPQPTGQRTSQKRRPKKCIACNVVFSKDNRPLICAVCNNPFCRLCCRSLIQLDDNAKAQRVCSHCKIAKCPEAKLKHIQSNVEDLCSKLQNMLTRPLPRNEQESQTQMQSVAGIEEMFLQQQLRLDNINEPSLRDERRALTEKLQRIFSIIDGLRIEASSTFIGARKLAEYNSESPHLIKLCSTEDAVS